MASNTAITAAAASPTSRKLLDYYIGGYQLYQLSETNHMTENEQRPPRDERIQEMRRQVEEVKSVMASNVASVLERGERLDSIERRTDELQASSANFKLTAHRVQRKMCIMNAKWTIIAVLSAIFVLAVIILLILNACGVFDKKKE